MRAGGFRWGLSFAVVTALHAAPAAVAGWWLYGEEPLNPAPVSAIMVELAPRATAMPATPTEIPPGPEQQRSEASQPRKTERPPVSKRPAAAMLARSENNRPSSEERVRVEQTTAPPAALAPHAPTAAPVSSAAPLPSDAAPDWQGLLLGRLEAMKRYPSEAQARRQQGIAYLRFTMDRDGKVLSFVLEKSARHALLDREALALIQRAQPLPKPPPDMPGEVLELVVPIEFFLSDRRS